MEGYIIPVIAAIVIAVPIKILLMNWYGKRRKDEKANESDRD